jgi:DNA-binding beta-propeller fold protein YncE
VLSGHRYKFNNPAAIAAAGTGVWVANHSGSVTELNASTGTLVRVLSGPGYGFNNPAAIAADGTRVWVANYGGDSVTEFPQYSQ